MKRLLAPAAVALLAANAGACAQKDPAALVERQWEICETMNHLPQQQIEACSAIIAFEGASSERRVAALIDRGAKRAQLGQMARAIADFGRALRIDPANAQAHLERGLAHERRGAYEAALQAFDAALAAEPRMQLAQSQRAQTLSLLEVRWRERLERLDAALARNSHDARLRNERCWVLAISGGDLDRALADCEAALKAEPALAAALDSRALVHLKRGEFEAAAADYEAALRLEPGRGHFLFGRGLARIAMGLKAEGESDLEAGERAEPGVGDAYRRYGAAL